MRFREKLIGISLFFQYYTNIGQTLYGECCFTFLQELMHFNVAIIFRFPIHIGKKFKYFKYIVRRFSNHNYIARNYFFSGNNKLINLTLLIKTLSVVFFTYILITHDELLISKYDFFFYIN